VGVKVIVDGSGVVIVICMVARRIVVVGDGGELAIIWIVDVAVSVDIDGERLVRTSRRVRRVEDAGYIAVEGVALHGGEGG